jgi:nucleoside 2-deoxyribosyltransferase
VPYPARNWEQGLSFTETVGSLERHIAKFKLGDDTEDHVAAVLFNAMVLAHEQEEIKAGRLPASLDDMPHYVERTPVNSVELTPAGLRYGTATREQLDTVLDASSPVKPDSVSHPFTVYLCGPITGVHRDHIWRDVATGWLRDRGIQTLNPLRGKKPEALSDQGMGYEGVPASVEMADRDKMDVEQADLIFAHFPYMPPRQSIGSLMELGIAANMGKPIVLCAGKDTEFNKHLFTRRFCRLEPNFAEALEAVVDIARAGGFI